MNFNFIQWIALFQVVSPYIPSLVSAFAISYSAYDIVMNKTMGYYFRQESPTSDAQLQLNQMLIDQIKALQSSIPEKIAVASNNPGLGNTTNIMVPGANSWSFGFGCVSTLVICVIVYYIFASKGNNNQELKEHVEEKVVKPIVTNIGDIAKTNSDQIAATGTALAEEQESIRGELHDLNIRVENLARASAWASGTLNAKVDNVANIAELNIKRIYEINSPPIDTGSDAFITESKTSILHITSANSSEYREEEKSSPDKGSSIYDQCRDYYDYG